MRTIKIILGLASLCAAYCVCAENDFDFLLSPVPQMGDLDLSEARILPVRGICDDLLNQRSLLRLNHQGLGLNTGKDLLYAKESKLRALKIRYSSSVHIKTDQIQDKARAASLLKRVAPRYLSESEIFALLQSKKKINLFDVLPPFVRVESRETSESKKSCLDGNCYNAALRLHSLLIFQNQTQTHEMIESLRNDFRALTKNENPEYGDLMVFWSGNANAPAHQDSLFHAALYLDEDLVLHKPSRFAEDILSVQSLPEVFRYFLSRTESLRATFHRAKKDY